MHTSFLIKKNGKFSFSIYFPILMNMMLKYEITFKYDLKYHQKIVQRSLCEDAKHLHCEWLENAISIWHWHLC